MVVQVVGGTALAERSMADALRDANVIDWMSAMTEGRTTVRPYRWVRPDRVAPASEATIGEL